MNPFRQLPAIVWLESVDSTNDELRRRLPGIDNLSVIAAECQTAGRGQGDHKWTSEPGCNLTFSMLIDYPAMGIKLMANDTARINEVITSGLVDFLKEYGIDSWVKPFNDIWVADKKICGILIENILSGKYVSKTILGVGMNVNQTVFPDYLPNPVSMAQLTGKKYGLKPTLERLREVLVSKMPDFLP